MATVVVTITIMPASPDVDLEALAKKASEKIVAFGASEPVTKEDPIAFGLKALKMTFTYDEKLGGTDDLEAQLAEFEEVNSAEATDVRRAIG